MDHIKFNYLKNNYCTSHGYRIVAEMEYCYNLSLSYGGKYDEMLDRAIEYLYGYVMDKGVIDATAVAETEAILGALSPVAKEDTILCISHAHIDMNWMWGYGETVNITLSTFRTMLKLMEEYPEFTFSQSQASVYEIVERFDPKMFEEIKRRVKEGRWEITASTWVETDKNMVNGEGLARHILYTKQYLSEKFDLPKDYFCMDFEPDTFGHNANVPEILNKGGIKYYYHCRGKFVPDIYRWKAPSGAKVLVYREPFWYNGGIVPTEFSRYPALMRKYGVHMMPNVFGVGDHGGGPTRRDLNKIRELNTWPLMPNFRFSSYREFYEYIDKNAVNVPEIEGELNFVYTGCYTSQSRIKAANRQGERLLNQTDRLLAFAPDVKSDVESAWRLHLFNHFHDILPGSGVRDTREYALGKAQERNAILSTAKTMALTDIAARIDKTALGLLAQDVDDRAMGAGVGFYSATGVYSANTSSGDVRGYLVVNNAPWVKEYVELTLWDYDHPIEQLRVTDGAGNELKFEVRDVRPMEYWAHKFRRIFVNVNLAPDSYKTVVISADKNVHIAIPEPCDWDAKDYRQHFEEIYVLENSSLRAEFDCNNASLMKLTDKKSGRVFGDGVKPVAEFRYVVEDGSKDMDSWVVGRRLYDTPHRQGRQSQTLGVQAGRRAEDVWLRYAVWQIVGYERLRISSR